MLTRIASSYQQQPCLRFQFPSYPPAAIVPIGKRYSLTAHQGQTHSSLSIIKIAWQKQSSYKVSIDVYRSVQLEAKEPSFARLAEICPVLTKQAHTAMTDGVAYRYWLRVEDKQITIKPITSASRFTQMSNDFGQGVKPSYPLLVRRKTREGGTMTTLLFNSRLGCS